VKLYIPALGTCLSTTKAWTFSLFCEERNKSLWDLVTGMPKMDTIPLRHRRGNMAAVTIPANTELTVDRIFIRKNQSMFNSVTFIAWVEHFGVKHRVRFWVPLDAVNGLECEVI